jgi:Bacterial Ig-like domain (group 2)
MAMRRVTALLVGLASVLGIFACGGSGGGPGGITIISGSIAYFVVRATANADTVSVLAGSTAQLNGTAFDASLNQLALVGDTVWTSRDEAVATVDAHGLVTTLAAGSTWVVGGFKPKNSPTTFSDSVFVISQGPQ